MILEPKAIGLERLERMRAKHSIRAGKPVGIKGWTDHKATVAPNAKAGDIIRVILTSDHTDLDREVLLPEGADLSYLNANRKVFADHWYDVEHTVGSVKKLEFTPQGLVLEVRMLVDSPYPLVKAITGMAQQCGIGASIGFDPHEWGPPTSMERLKYPNAENMVRKWAALEASMTPMPCNVTCQSLGVTMDDSLVAPSKRLKIEVRRTLRLVRTLIVS